MRGSPVRQVAEMRLDAALRRHRDNPRGASAGPAGTGGDVEDLHGLGKLDQELRVPL
jgi:hypothetical protein